MDLYLDLSDENLFAHVWHLNGFHFDHATYSYFHGGGNHNFHFSYNQLGFHNKNKALDD